MIERTRAYRAIGLFGVIGSLIFVGLEVHQNTIRISSNSWTRPWGSGDRLVESRNSAVPR